MEKILIVLMITSILLVACQNESSNKFPTNQINNKAAITPEKNDYETFKSAVDNLRVRIEPNTDSRIVYQLQEGEEVIYLGEKSDNRETIKLRGKNIKDYWYKVKTNDDVIGWVFGGALQKQSAIQTIVAQEDDLKKISNFSAKQVEALTGLNGIRKENEPYNGRYEYYLTQDGSEILDGEFYVKGRDLPDSYLPNTINYKGTFKNGDKDGKFLENREYSEITQTTEITFRRNQCTITKVYGNQEGSTFNDEYDNHTCTFAFNKHHNLSTESYKTYIPPPKTTSSTQRTNTTTYAPTKKPCELNQTCTISVTNNTNDKCKIFVGGKEFSLKPHSTKKNLTVRCRGKLHLKAKQMGVRLVPKQYLLSEDVSPCTNVNFVFPVKRR